MKYFRSRSTPGMEKDLVDIEELLLDDTVTSTGLLSQAHGPLTWRPLDWMKQNDDGRRSLSRTAYLDGLRGFAALLVYVLHHGIWAHSRSLHESFILERGFGRDGEYYFICAPFVRVFFAGGHFAVAIFFIISGYVLSAKPLSLVQAGDFAALAENLGSALFRRWARLFLPVLCTTFIWMTCWHLFRISSTNSATVPPAETWSMDIWRWYCDFKNYSFVFNGEVTNAYNDHAWSLPLEFRGSVVVYTSILAFARCTTNTRLALEAGLAWFFLYVVDGWYCSLFVMGMLLCDLDLLHEKDQLPAWLLRLKPRHAWVNYVLLAVSLYLAGVPSISNDTAELRLSPGWHLLSFLKPQAVYDVRWFFRFWAATLAMVTLPRISSLKRFFETHFCQYLGKISFGFYLVHGPILWTLGDRVYAATGRVREASIPEVAGWINVFPLPNWGPFGLEINYLLPHLILLPFTLWMAEAVTQLIDQPTVRLMKNLLNRCIGSKRNG